MRSAKGFARKANSSSEEYRYKKAIANEAFNVYGRGEKDISMN